MKIWRPILISVLFMVSSKPVLNDLEIAVSIPTQAKPDLNKTLYCFGDEHDNLCPEEDTKEQIDCLDKIYSKAKDAGDPAYHTLVEAAKPICASSNAPKNILRDLMSVTESKGFLNIDNIEIRSEAIAAGFILDARPPWMLLTKIQKPGAFQSTIRKSFPHFKIEDLTLKDTITEHFRLIEEARGRIDSIKDTAARKIYTDDLQAIIAASESKIETCRHSLVIASESDTKSHLNSYRRRLQDHENIFDISSRIYNTGDPENDRKLFDFDIYDLTADLFDLNLFYQILMLEDKPVKKIIILSHRLHIQPVLEKLQRTGRYRNLARFTSPDFFYVQGNIARHSNVPLQISLFSLMEVPREDLEWEVYKARITNYLYLLYKHAWMKLLLI